MKSIFETFRMTLYRDKSSRVSKNCAKYSVQEILLEMRLPAQSVFALFSEMYERGKKLVAHKIDYNLSIIPYKYRMFKNV